jgi:hypothetical protein
LSPEFTNLLQREVFGHDDPPYDLRLGTLVFYMILPTVSRTA